MLYEVITECLHNPDVLSYGLLLTNLLVVAIMVQALRERRRQASAGLR